MFPAKDYKFPSGKKTYIMGILNYTPDSFSDGGKYNNIQSALAHAEKMQADGADIIDVGAVSTRPDGIILPEEEELSRLKEILPVLSENTSVAISVDTFRPVCAGYALKNGASIINDVSGTFNRDIAELVKQSGAGYIVMHNPCGAGNAFDYPDGVIPHIRNFFVDCLHKANEIGLGSEHLCLDPGFGFGKTTEENYEILENLQWLKFSSVALMVALSRKRFLAQGDDTPADRDMATAAANAVAICNGADIIRVHNTADAVKYAKTADAICRKA